MKNILFLLFLILPFVGFSQKKQICIERLPLGYDPFLAEKQYKTSRISAIQPYCIRTYITVFADDDGSRLSATDEQIMFKFEEMVNDYKPFGICFMLIDIHQVNNSDLNTQNEATEESELDPFKLEHCLNLFIHHDFTDPDLRGSSYSITSKYASFDRNGIVNPSFKSILSHEVGHCFGLLHTFSTLLGAEHVARSGIHKNCEIAGDFLCDTPADDDGGVNTSCVYDGGGVDELGEPYTPMTNNIMAYSDDEFQCLDIFTDEQGDRMRAHINGISFSLIVVNHTVNSPLIPFDNINIDSGISHKTARDELYISKFTGNEYNVTGSARHFIQSKKVVLGKGTHLNPDANGRIEVKSNTYCN